MMKLEIFIQGLWQMKWLALPFILMFILTGLSEAIDNKWETREKGIK